MLYTSKAIVLRTVKYGETSLIADLFTEQKGHQTFIINSVRKAKATTPASYLQLMSLLEIVAYFQEHKPINRIKEVRLDVPYKTIPFDMRKSAVITCVGEICSKCIKTAEPYPELFHFLHDELVQYDRPETYDRDFLIRFLVSLSAFLGFGMEIQAPSSSDKFFDLLNGQLLSIPSQHQYLMSIEDYKQLLQIMACGPDQKASVSHEVRVRLVDQLILFYQLHVESLREVKSLSVLRTLF